MEKAKFIISHVYYFVRTFYKVKLLNSFSNDFEKYLNAFKNKFKPKIILNKFLRRLNIIKKDEKLCFPTFEEELIDINELINDIYTKTSTSNNKLFDNNIEKVNNMLDDIFYNLLNNNNEGNN